MSVEILKNVEMEGQCISLKIIKYLLQRSLETIYKNGGAHKQLYWTCSDKHYCFRCKYGSDVCMYGEKVSDYDDKTPCADNWIKNVCGR